MEQFYYHGSPSSYDHIDVSYGKSKKDFGAGFYLTNDYNHARSIALLRANKLNASSKKVDCIYIYAYLFDLNNFKDYNVLVFKDAKNMSQKEKREWIKFVIDNRFSKHKIHEFDIVYGPTADARAMYEINFYKNVLEYNPKAANINELIEGLNIEKYPSQTYIGNQEICDIIDRTLRYKRRIKI